MTIYFLDASALAKRYLNEVGTPWIRAICSSAQDVPMASAVTRVEVAAAIAARHRAQTITETERREAVRLLAAHFVQDYQTIPVDLSMLDRAVQLTEAHRLRGYDAVQLATCLTVVASIASARPMPVVFVSADRDLLSAATREGLIVDDPNTHT